MKKILIGLAIVIGVISIAVNIIFVTQVFRNFIPDLKDSNRSVAVTKYFGFADSNITIILDSAESLDSSIESTYLKYVDSTIYNLQIIQEELVGTSGGIDPETGKFINSSNKHYVREYFFGTNYFRHNSINFFKESIEGYLNEAEKLNINSSLSYSLELHNKYNGGTLFDDLTVAESFNFIELLIANIVVDKYAYLAEIRK